MESKEIINERLSEAINKMNILCELSDGHEFPFIETHDYKELYSEIRNAFD
jgi:hypothetical protein